MTDPNIARILIAVFLCSAGILVYTYLLFPIVLWFLSAIMRFKSRADETLEPSAAILFAACNEEKVIREKIENILSLDYPREKLEIHIGSDASEDKTDEIIKSFGDRIRFKRIEPRQGKSNVLNTIAVGCDCEIFIFSDANTMYKEDAVRKLVRHFADERIGGVCGKLVLKGQTEAALGEWEKSYWSVESVIKSWEGRLGRVLGANGAIYAIRKELFSPIPTKRLLMDDFFMGIHVLKKYKRFIFDPEAMAFEGLSEKDAGEFTRKIRIARANFNYLWTQPGVLLSANLLFLFLFVSHKLFRWFSPFLMILCLGTNGLLAFLPVFRFVLLLQLIFYFFALIGLSLGKKWKCFAVPYYFVSMNAALFLGFFQSLSSRQTISWKRVER